MLNVQTMNVLDEENTKKRYQNQLKGIVDPKKDFTLFDKAGEKTGDCIKLCSSFLVF